MLTDQVGSEGGTVSLLCRVSDLTHPCGGERVIRIARVLHWMGSIHPHAPSWACNSIELRPLAAPCAGMIFCNDQLKAMDGVGGEAFRCAQLSVLVAASLLHWR